MQRAVGLDGQGVQQLASPRDRPRSDAVRWRRRGRQRHLPGMRTSILHAPENNCSPNWWYAVLLEQTHNVLKLRAIKTNGVVCFDYAGWLWGTAERTQPHQLLRELPRRDHVLWTLLRLEKLTSHLHQGVQLPALDREHRLAAAASATTDQRCLEIDGQ